jgi:dihydrofolate reductase
MRKLIVGTFLSLDGVMQAPGGPDEDTSGGFRFGGWIVPHFDEAGGEVLEGWMSQPYDLLLGRRTYDIFAAYWPHQPQDHPDHAIAETFNRITKYVATHRPDGLDWHNSEWLGEDVVARLRELKAGDGPALLVQGSSELVHQLLASGLVDEFHLMVFPVLLGRGKRLFDDGTLPSALKLVQSRVSDSGVVMATYVPDGEVRTGSFA